MVCGQGKARDIWAHVGVLGALRDPGALGCGTQPFVRKAWRRPQAFSSDPKIRGSQGPSRGRGGFLGRGCCADGRGRMWLFPVPWAREWKEGPNSPFWSSGGHLSPAFVPLSLHHPQPCCSQGRSGAAPWEAPKRDLLFWPLLSPEVTPSPFRAGWLIPRGSACWELGELRIWTGKVLAFNPLSGLF